MGRWFPGADIDYMSGKVAGLRIFEDSEGKMNLDLSEVKGEVLLVSQFTLSGDVRKGQRPSFISAETPEKAAVLIEALAERLCALGVAVSMGRFQAHMEVSLDNDGPVTILLDSRKGF